MKKIKWADKIINFVKGMFIGSGFILPGVSGGALAAVFGIYERIIAFLADIKKDFKKNVIFFLPIGFGALAGIYLLSLALDYTFKNAEYHVVWFFIGCVLGTLPALVKQANKKGHKKYHLGILSATFVLAFLFLYFGKELFGEIDTNFFTWLIGGAIIAIGMLVPGLSPSNFLLYLGMYDKLTEGIKNFDMMIILPVGIGGLLCVLSLAKLMAWLLKKAYTGLMFFILGVVGASTLMIIPIQDIYSPLNVFLFALLLALGVTLGLFMGKLEEKYKPED